MLNMNPNKIRKVYAPYSTTGEQVGQTPLEGYVDVAQAIYPAVNTGQIGKDGEWSGVTVSDKTFTIDTEHLGIPNGAAVLSPQKADHEYIDMTGFNDVFLALKPSNAGNYAVSAVMAPDTYPFANLSPVNPASILLGVWMGMNTESYIFRNLFDDSAQSLVADVWNIFNFVDLLKNQKLLQFKIVNNSGGNSDIQFAYMRMV